MCVDEYYLGYGRRGKHFSVQQLVFWHCEDGYAYELMVYIAHPKVHSYKSLLEGPFEMKNQVVRARSRNVIHETATVHESNTMQAFIRNEIIRKQWIYKIIAGEKEQENVLYRCDDYVILPDTDVSMGPATLNWLVVFTDKSLTSMRCLRGEHTPILHSIKRQIGACIPTVYDAPMIYFHYPPSVWQLHLHIATPCDALRTTSCMQRVCFLEDVICNLSIDPEYYCKATLTYILPSNHDLTQIAWSKKILDFIKVT